MTNHAQPQPSPFETAFLQLTGSTPFPWQCKLYDDWFSQGEVPERCAIPTGLGKTSVIAVWLIALANAKDNGARLPRRLVYVVNRRTVVDQTTTEVERLRDKLLTKPPGELVGGELDLGLRRLCAMSPDDNGPPLAISTLRGKFADNREWSADPARPAVICGTVDMIGSRLLFSGYGVGFKGKPLHAGFLGQDALLVHDEAHLEPAFQCLVDRIVEEQKRELQLGAVDLGQRLRVMELSATSRGAGTTLKLDSRDYEHETVAKRIRAKKPLDLEPIAAGKKLADQLAKRALEFKESGKAILVYATRVEDVNRICELLRAKGSGVGAEHVQSLTGTMRGKERDDLVECKTFQRFLPSKESAAESQPTAYLVCTSAGEVGVNITADHLVCDLSTLDSMIQRFGRVNRFGEQQDTQVIVVHPPVEELDRSKPLEAARAKTLELLGRLTDASPGTLGDLMTGLSDEDRRAAFAPEPTMLPATDILFDAWSLTTIKNEMPGRPAVAEFLHGLDDEQSRTTIAWRAELDLLKDELKDDPNPASKLKAIFAKHRIRPHETLSVGSHYAARYFKDVAKARPDLLNVRVALQFARNLELTTIESLSKDPRPLYAEPTVIFPASFGGLEDGMLTVPKLDKKSKTDDADDQSERASTEAAASKGFLDIADLEGYERDKDAATRKRVLIERSDDLWAVRAYAEGTTLPGDWRIEPTTATKLVNAVRRASGLVVRLVQDIAFNDDDEPTKSLVCLAPPPRQLAQPCEEQLLDDHVGAVVKEAERLSDALFFDNRVVRAAIAFSAKWHDEGKKAKIWQRYIGRKDGQPPLGKSAEWRDWKILAGYRHEFGSLLRIKDEEARAFFAERRWGLSGEEQKQAMELALHMIAAHHGQGRPHFVHPWDNEVPAQCEEVHLATIRRYARLQRKYGRWGLAYLESILRAADWAASAAVGHEAGTDDDDVEGDEA